MTLAAAAAAFSLICTGTATGGAEKGGRPRPTRATYQVDLDSRRFCTDRCTAVASIKEIRSDHLVLSSGPTTGFTGHQAVDLSTGAWTSMVKAELSTFTTTGTCRKGPFGGFSPR